MTRPVVLTLCDYYLPGFRAGGPITTLLNTFQALAEDFSFRVITRNRDCGVKEPYPDVPLRVWQDVRGVPVQYLDDSGAIPGLHRLLRETPHDVLYLKSVMSPVFSIAPLVLRRASLIPRRPTVLAPRGELAAGALDRKRTKKLVYLSGARALGLHRDVLWQASSELEREDVRRWFGQGAAVHLAPDARRVADPAAEFTDGPAKKPGQLRLLFFARVHPHKNLLQAIEMLHGVRGDVELAVIGPVEDPPYWTKCQAAMEALPANVRADYRGSVRPDEVLETMRGHDLLILPTSGESFGHSILEALLAGLPVLISDRTPWRDLEASGVGWEVALENADGFRRAIQHCVDAGAAEFAALRRRAFEYGLAVATGDKVLHSNRELFARAASGAPA